MRKVIMCFVALLTIAAAAAGPAWGQNANVSWVLTPHGDLQTGDTVVIVDKTSARALPKPASSSSAPGTISVTLNSAKDTLTSTPGATLKWVVVRDGDNYKFRKPGTDNEYLYFTDADNGVRVGNNENNQFSFENGGTYNVPFLKNNATTRYFGLTNTNYWRSLSDNSTSTIKNTVIGFYKRTVIPTYTVTFAEGTEDVGDWDITPAAAATNTGVTEGTVVTVKYNGTRRINSIELKSKMLTTPLTMEALTAGTIMVQSPQSGMQYSKNGGAKTAVTSAAIDVSVGDKVAFYGDSTNITRYDGTYITGGTAEVKVYGNIMSLVNETGFDTATTLTANGAFSRLFKNNAKLSDASGLLLPATTLASNCYANMFYGCSSLTTAPALPATTLAINCYNSMFQRCTSLTTAPELPAQTLASNCYANMFQNCRKLNSVTCLATSGIDQSSSTFNWLQNAGTEVEGTKTVFTNPNAAANAWPTNSVDGIPENWTRQDIGAQSTPEPVTLVPTGNTNEWTLTMPADNMLLMVNYAPAHTVRFADGNDGWTVKAVSATTHVASAAVTAPDILQNVMAGDSLVVTAPTPLPGKVKSVKAVKYVPPVVITWNTTNVLKEANQNDELNRSHRTPLTYEGIEISFSGNDVSSFNPYSTARENPALECHGDDGDSFTFTAPSGKKFTKIEINDNSYINFDAYGDWTKPENNKIVWRGTAANAVTLGSVFTLAGRLNSIVFTLIDAQ